MGIIAISYVCSAHAPIHRHTKFESDGETYESLGKIEEPLVSLLWSSNFMAIAYGLPTVWQNSAGYGIVRLFVPSSSVNWTTC